MARCIQQQSTMSEARLVLNGSVIDNMLQHECAHACIKTKLYNVFYPRKKKAGSASIVKKDPKHTRDLKNTF